MFLLLQKLEKRIFKICKNLIDVTTAAQGRREGGQGGTMTPEPMGFRKAVGLSGPSRGPMSSREGPSKWHWEISMWSLKTFSSFFFFFFGDHLNSTGKTVRISVKTFFFSEITSFFEPNYSIFSVILDFTKPEIRHIWAGPGPTFGARCHCSSLKVRSQEFAWRGLFWSLETSSHDIDPDFDGSLNRLSRFFFPNEGDLQKKKGLHQNWVVFCLN